MLHLGLSIVAERDNVGVVTREVLSIGVDFVTAIIFRTLYHDITLIEELFDL